MGASCCVPGRDPAPSLFSWHGETVLDPFAGTGTTAAAAVPLGRNVLCIEQNDEYVDIIRRDCGHLKNGHRTAAELMNVVHGDSRDLSFVEDASISLVVSSPPLEQGGLRLLAHEPGSCHGLPPLPRPDQTCFRGVLPGPATWPEVLSGDGEREPAHRLRAPDLPASGRLRRHPARHRLHDGHRDNLVEGRHRRAVGTRQTRSVLSSAVIPIRRTFCSRTFTSASSCTRNLPSGNPGDRRSCLTTRSWLKQIGAPEGRVQRWTASFIFRIRRHRTPSTSSKRSLRQFGEPSRAQACSRSRHETVSTR